MPAIWMAADWGLLEFASEKISEDVMARSSEK
jgi:hypothetical protein